MNESVFLVKLLPDYVVDPDATEEIFGIYSDIELAKMALEKFSKQIETEIVENVDYEISKLELNTSNYLSK
jgi:proteasome assembly chaperone (PAC2) family protein